MKKSFVACLLLAVLSLQLPENAKAESAPKCAPRNTIIEGFAAEFGETVEATGAGPFGLTIELLTASTGTFTILVTRPDGISCILAAGTNWHSLGGDEVGEAT